MKNQLTEFEVELMNDYPSLISEMRMTMKLVRTVMVVSLVGWGVAALVLLVQL